jgi:hypothetical protein
VPHAVVTDPVHVAARERMRGTRARVAVAGPADADVEVRDLAVYDRLLGIAS